jgi:hypothetical protein
VRRRVALWALALVAWLFAAPLWAEDSPVSLPEKTFRVKLNADRLELSVSFEEVFDKKRLEKLDSGLTTTILVRAYLYDESDMAAPIALGVREIKILYDIWAEEYSIQLSEPASSLSVTTTEKQKAVTQASTLIDFALPLGAPLGEGKSYFLAVLVEINPLSPAVVREMRRWLSRSSASGARSSSFFGSFVSVFANIQKGSAERSLRFRSPSFVVPAKKK